MAVRTLPQGTRTAFGSASNLNSLANNAAKPLGAIDNSINKKPYAWVELTVTLGSSGISSTGTIEWYLIQALVNSAATDWQDGIDPASTSDVASSIKNARRVRTSTANANSQVVRERFQLPVADPGKYWTIVALNKTGAAFASSGNGAYYADQQDDLS